MPVPPGGTSLLQASSSTVGLSLEEAGVRRLGDEGGASRAVEAALPGGRRRREGAALDARPATNQEARRAFKLLQPREPAAGIVSAEHLGKGRRLRAGLRSAVVARPAGEGYAGGRGSVPFCPRVPGEGRGALLCPSGSRGQRRGTCSGGLGGVQVHCHSPA